MEDNTFSKIKFDMMMTARSNGYTVYSMAAVVSVSSKVSINHSSVYKINQSFLCNTNKKLYHNMPISIPMIRATVRLCEEKLRTIIHA